MVERMIKREKGGNRLIIVMGSCKDEKSRRVWRGLKTLFFLVTMLISLLLFSAPVLLVIADAFLPSAILSTSLPLSFGTLSSYLSNYDFRYSLIDIPLISIARSAVILCAYYLCDGPMVSRGPYLGVTALCSLLSLIFVSFKASYVLFNGEGEGYNRVMEMELFVCSWALAIAHTVVAYRTSCRQRRKLLVYKIDIEAVSACKKGFPAYQKLVKEERMK
ncbi:uncharacterized protein LOC122649109 [Telopea speciosissima]|uniref:uncharacterized protein LOC122649109 n=1 Tax=Telopea speciosissima TaxID=54955 RepID=UPI001CC6671B|nr:uncharacterized protein LOC122649109 [Telopea speciosissima]XP_043698409.1 uncharacterized protein LOC122649109 [Telopea speciosissima]